MAQSAGLTTAFGAARDRDRRLIYAVAAGRGGIFILPVLVTYFDEHIGLSFREFLFTESIYAAVLIAMEVPSGWFADRTRRKTALAIGALGAMVGFALLWQVNGLAGAMLPQAVIGIGLSLVSGADTALLYEVLAALGRKRSLAILPLALLSILGLAGALPGHVGITALLLNSAAWGYGWPAVQAAMNGRIDEERRATILSLANMALKLAFIPLSALLGLLEERAGAAGALTGLSALLALAWLMPGSPLRKPER